MHKAQKIFHLLCYNIVSLRVNDMVHSLRMYVAISCCEYFLQFLGHCRMLKQCQSLKYLLLAGWK